MSFLNRTLLSGHHGLGFDTTLPAPLRSAPGLWVEIASRLCDKNCLLAEEFGSIIDDA